MNEQKLNRVVPFILKLVPYKLRHAVHMGPHCNTQPQRCNYLVEGWRLVRIGVLEKEERNMGLSIACVCLWTEKYGPLGKELLCPGCRNRIIEVVAVRVPWDHQNIIFATPSSP